MLEKPLQISVAIDSATNFLRTFIVQGLPRNKSVCPISNMSVKHECYWWEKASNLAKCLKKKKKGGMF